MRYFTCSLYVLRSLILLILLILSAVHGNAQLSWDTQSIQFTPPATDTEVHAIYNFTNEGLAPITVTSIETSCHCTTAKLTKTTYQPGEKGHIDVTMRFLDQMGWETKTITVKTAEFPNPSTLTLRVHIPEVVQITPNHLVWHVGENPTPKVMDLMINYPSPFKIVGVETTYDGILPKLKVIDSGKQYQITVEPSTTKDPASAILYIKTTLPSKPLILAYADIVQ
jgi:Protein of unknown function (DUF1573)